MVKKALLVGAAAVVAIVLAIGGASEPIEVREANVAACNPAQTTIRSGPAGWRSSISAGPVAVHRQPLQGMSETRKGQLYTRMELLVRGHHFVVLSVPLALRDRVFLYYGRILDSDGNPTKSPHRARGYAETELRPCRDRSATTWRGGIRVIGGGPVNLLVTVEGHSGSASLPLGRPVSDPTWRNRRNLGGT